MNYQNERSYSSNGNTIAGYIKFLIVHPFKNVYRVLAQKFIKFGITLDKMLGEKRGVERKLSSNTLDKILNCD